MTIEFAQIGDSQMRGSPRHKPVDETHFELPPRPHFVGMLLIVHKRPQMEIALEAFGD